MFGQISAFSVTRDCALSTSFNHRALAVIRAQLSSLLTLSQCLNQFGFEPSGAKIRRFGILLAQAF
jgi:hypothetical protein